MGREGDEYTATIESCGVDWAGRIWPGRIRQAGTFGLPYDAWADIFRQAELGRHLQAGIIRIPKYAEADSGRIWQAQSGRKVRQAAMGITFPAPA